MNTFNNCKWAVAHKIDKETQDDRKTKIRVVAIFNTPINAEDFITNCLPKETKERLQNLPKQRFQKERRLP